MVPNSALCIFVLSTIIIRTIYSVPITNLNPSFAENRASDITSIAEYDSDYPVESEDDEKPSPPPLNQDFDKYLDNLLDSFYEKYINPLNHIDPNLNRHQHKKSGASIKKQEEYKDESQSNDLYDQMQGDQPVEEQNNYFPNGLPRLPEYNDLSTPLYVNLSAIVNFTRNGTDHRNRNTSDAEYMRAMRNRTKDTWIQVLKDNILRQVGRVNSTGPSGEEMRSMDFPALPLARFTNGSTSDDEEYITEKIRSYYPSCEIPRNTDQDVWKDDTSMNLYFDFDQTLDENDVKIATATLRLYRLSQENATSPPLIPGDVSCENSSLVEDERLLRISIYWYTRSLRRHRVKRRLCDSKVVGENSKWVELSVRPATRAWAKGKNLGLAVLVEDQDGVLLKADQIFKGASCTVGTSTPKPIPTVIIDAARRANELERNNGNPGRNSTTTFYNHLSLLPTIDICTIQFPENYNQTTRISSLRVNACNLRKISEQTQKITEKDILERLATLPDLMPHIRHQRQHLTEKIGRLEGLQSELDPRARIIGRQVIYTNEQLDNFESENSTDINR